MEKKIIDINSINNVDYGKRVDFPERPFERGFDEQLTRENQRIITVGIDGKPLTPAQIANAMIMQGKRWGEYEGDKNFFNAGAIYGGLTDTLTGMNEVMRQAVFTEIEKIKTKAALDIQACNLINSIRSDIEKAKEPKQQGDDGMTM